MFKEYKEAHQQGIITLENVPTERLIEGDLGIQIAKDGRVWVCINGVAFIRFKPQDTKTEKTRGGKSNVGQSHQRRGQR